MKNISVRKTQLQMRLDTVKSQHAAMLQKKQDLQTKLNEGQQRLKDLSEQYMKLVNQTPTPEELRKPSEGDTPLPMAVETFVTSLGLTLTEEQRHQLHGLLKRPIPEPEDPSKRRKTEGTVPPSPP